MRRATWSSLALLALLLPACSDRPDDTPAAVSGAEALTDARVGAVFTMSNDASDNRVLAFRRGPDGALTAAGEVSTGGQGSGGGLGSQRAVVLTENGRFLLVVNAGSNDISSFAARGADLSLLSRVPSGGQQPVSLAVHRNVVYTLNAGVPNSVSGFRLDHEGRLSPIEGSARPLSAASAAPAQVSFSPRGRALIVTEKATNVIDTFAVRYDGTLGANSALPSAGKTPFGFAFTPNGRLLVSEAFGGAPASGAVSSYALDRDPDADGDTDSGIGLETISESVPDLQSAPCWVVVTRAGDFAYTSNTASGTVSGYRVARDGTLHLLDGGPSGVTGDGTKPIDMALDEATRHLYVLDSGTHDIVEFDVSPDGALARSGAALSVPPGSVGLAAR